MTILTGEHVHQASQKESKRHQCVMGENIEIVPHWLWAKGWTNLKVEKSFTSKASF
jgi:hypothetical protein